MQNCDNCASKIGAGTTKNCHHTNETYVWSMLRLHPASRPTLDSKRGNRAPTQLPLVLPGGSLALRFPPGIKRHHAARHASQQRSPSITYCVNSPTLSLSTPSFSRVRPRRQ
jgi:hypothetical protein